MNDPQTPEQIVEELFGVEMPLRVDAHSGERDRAMWDARKAARWAMIVAWKAAAGYCSKQQDDYINQSPTSHRDYSAEDKANAFELAADHFHDLIRTLDPTHGEKT